MTRILSGIIAALLLALLFSLSQCSKEREQNSHLTSNVTELLSNQAQITKDAKGRVTATKVSAELKAKDLLKIIAGQNQQLKNLQEAVKAGGKEVKSAVAFQAVTVTKAAGPVDSIAYEPASPVVCAADTVHEDPCPKPTYFGTVQAFGYTAKVRAAPDTIKIVSATTNDFVVSLHTKGGLFRRPVPIVVIKALNPATGVEQVQSWQQPQDRPRRGVWAIVGGVLVLVLTLAL
jgi:hypothetical protein